MQLLGHLLELHGSYLIKWAVIGVTLQLWGSELSYGAVIVVRG